MSVSSERKASLIIEKWTADLRSKDRKYTAVSGNFDELFSKLHEADLDFDLIHPMIDYIAKKHYPPEFTARKTYDKQEKQLKNLSYREFLDNWHKEIKEKALESFCAFFQHEVQTDEEKKYGSMSAKEYNAQRKYAESFKAITFEELQDRMKKIEIDLTKDLETTEDDNGKRE